MSAHGVLRWAMGICLLCAIGFLAWPQSFGGRTAFIGVDGQSMAPTYASGDLLVVRRQGTYHVGDVITYIVPKGEFGAGAHVVHRITGGKGTAGFVTQGDNRAVADEWHPRHEDVVGATSLRIPGAASWFQQLGRPVPLGALCAGLTVMVMLLPRRQP